jgi:hypothetical protein
VGKGEEGTNGIILCRPLGSLCFPLDVVSQCLSAWPSSVLPPVGGFGFLFIWGFFCFVLF